MVQDGRVDGQKLLAAADTLLDLLLEVMLVIVRARRLAITRGAHRDASVTPDHPRPPPRPQSQA